MEDVWDECTVEVKGDRARWVVAGLNGTALVKSDFHGEVDEAEDVGVPNLCDVKSDRVDAVSVVVSRAEVDVSRGVRAQERHDRSAELVGELVNVTATLVGRVASSLNGSRYGVREVDQVQEVFDQKSASLVHHKIFAVQATESLDLGVEARIRDIVSSSERVGTVDLGSAGIKQASLDVEVVILKVPIVVGWL